MIGREDVLKEWSFNEIPETVQFKAYDKYFLMLHDLQSGFAQIAFGVEDNDFYLPIWYFWIKDGKVENIYIPEFVLDDDELILLYNKVFPYEAKEIKSVLSHKFMGKEFELLVKTILEDL